MPQTTDLAGALVSTFLSSSPLLKLKRINIMKEKGREIDRRKKKEKE